MENMEADFFRHIFVRALITGEIQVQFDGMGNIPQNCCSSNRAVAASNRFLLPYNRLPWQKGQSP